jgi:hypothetical protein
MDQLSHKPVCAAVNVNGILMPVVNKVLRFLFGDLIEGFQSWKNRSRYVPPLPDPPPGYVEATLKAARRMMELLGYLHKCGYGGLRLYSSLSPSGCCWRGRISAGKQPDLTTGAFSTGAGPEVLFGWKDVEELRLSTLAERFATEFPELLNAARYPDRAYTDWYCDMLVKTSPGGLIYFSADFPLPESGVGVINCDCPGGITAPPEE